MRTLKVPLWHVYGESVYVAVFSDLHIGHVNYSRRNLQKFLSEVSQYDNYWLLGLGDHMECVVPADFKRWQTSMMVTGDSKDAVLDWQEDEFVSLIEPYKERLLGLAMGNHELEILRRYGHDPHASVCRQLGCENLGYSCLMRLNLRCKSGDSAPSARSVILYIHHGWGGSSRTAGGNVTKFSRAVETYWADIYLFGHSHDQFVRTIPRLMVDKQGKLAHRDATIVNVGTFKKTLTDGVIPSWEEKMGFPPRSLGGVVIELQSQRRGRPLISVY
jgi:hypothetical protein